MGGDTRRFALSERAVAAPGGDGGHKVEVGGNNQRVSGHRGGESSYLGMRSLLLLGGESLGDAANKERGEKRKTDRKKDKSPIYKSLDSEGVKH